MSAPRRVRPAGRLGTATLPGSSTCSGRWAKVRDRGGTHVAGRQPDRPRAGGGLCGCGLTVGGRARSGRRRSGRGRRHAARPGIGPAGPGQRVGAAAGSATRPARRAGRLADPIAGADPARAVPARRPAARLRPVRRPSGLGRHWRARSPDRLRAGAGLPQRRPRPGLTSRRPRPGPTGRWPGAGARGQLPRLWGVSAGRPRRRPPTRRALRPAHRGLPPAGGLPAANAGIRSATPGVRRPPGADAARARAGLRPVAIWTTTSGVRAAAAPALRAAHAGLRPAAGELRPAERRVPVPDGLLCTDPAGPHEPRKNKKLLIILAAVAAIALIGAIITVVSLMSGNNANFAVGDCVKQSGSKAVSATCSDKGAYKVLNKVDQQAKCVDPKQPIVVVERKGSKDE